LLSGVARCAACGGSMQAVSRRTSIGGVRGAGRLFRYVCSVYWNRGDSICGNRRLASMDEADAAIRALLAREVLRRDVLERALDRAVEMLSHDARVRDRASRRAEIARRALQ
jgi:Recombinase zinc beta ribbon domain